MEGFVEVEIKILITKSNVNLTLKLKEVFVTNQKERDLSEVSSLQL